MSRSSAGAGRRALAIAGSACLVIVAASIALVLATSSTTEAVAANARALHWANAAMGSASVARAANAQAVFFAVDHSAGFASVEDRDRALEEAWRAIDALEAVVESSEAGLVNPDEIASLQAFRLAASRVLNAVERGDVETALEENTHRVESSYSGVQSSLSAQIEHIRSLISTSEGTAGTISSITRALVTLFIPLTALVIYRLLVKRQMTERRIEFEAKLEAERELNQAKDEFIAGLSHEFRTPLTAIYGFSEHLIDAGLVDPDMSIELIGLINSESAELSRMVEDLLMAARLEAGALTIEDVSVDVEQEIGTIVAPFVRSGHSIQLRIEEGVVRADALRLRQILRNLISNATKHGGERIGVCGRRQDGVYSISVVDDGPGVPAPIVDSLFERFVHDGRRALLTGSVGLGLNIAKSLALAMGGDLVYERMQERTVFTVTVPTAMTDESTRSSPQISRTAVTG